MLKEKAFAKINLFLNVVNKRFDGYHDLEMVMASIDLFDTLTFQPIDSGLEVTSSIAITDNMEENIVFKIASYLMSTYQISSGVHIHINKNIPIAAGLGGGSADGAAALRGLNKLWKLGLTLDDLAKIGLEFGSDIPFCVYNKLCIAKGRGEELVFLDNKLKMPILVVNPKIHISTKSVFQQVREETIIEHKINDMLNGIYNNNIELIARELHNSLEQIVFEMEPKVKDIKTLMINWGVPGALMSGSGSTVFGICKHKNKLKQIQEMYQDEYFTTLTKIR